MKELRCPECKGIDIQVYALEWRTYSPTLQADGELDYGVSDHESTQEEQFHCENTKCRYQSDVLEDFIHEVEAEEVTP